MRFGSAIVLMCTVFLGSCVFKQDPVRYNLNGILSLNEARVHLPGHHLGAVNTLKVLEKSKRLSVKDGIITHGQFLYLEKLEDLNTDYLNNFLNVSAEFQLNPDLVKVYRLGTSRFDLKYENYIGHTLRVYDRNRQQHVLKMKELVVVTDPQISHIYLAAALDVPENTDLQYAWASSNKRLNPFPFTRVEDPFLAEDALTHFDSLSEYHRLKSEAGHSGESDYDGIETHLFSFGKDEHYAFLQYMDYGDCGFIDYSYSALFHITPGNWTLEAEGQLPYFFSDLVDIDADMYPEILMNNFSGTAIYEINYTGFHQREYASWWTSACPC